MLIFLSVLMNLFVQSLTGDCCCYEVSATDTVASLKVKIAEKEGLPECQQYLTYRSSMLEDGKLLSDYQIQSGVTVNLVPIARSGPLSYSTSRRYPTTTTVDENAFRLLEALSSQKLQGKVDVTDQEVEDLCRMVAGSSVATAITPPLCSSNELGTEGEEKFDYCFDEGQKLLAQQRAMDNVRMMKKMKELRKSIERLNAEKHTRMVPSFATTESPQITEEGPISHCVTQNKVPLISETKEDIAGISDSSHGGAVFHQYLSRQRKGSGGSSRQPCRPQKLVVKIHSKSSQADVEDTSAKESSAGETEFEENLETFSTIPHTTKCASPVLQQSPVSTTTIRSAGDRVNVASTLQMRRNTFSSILGSITSLIKFRSSSSDFDFDSSAAEHKATSAGSEELFTAGDLTDDEHYFTDSLCDGHAANYCGLERCYEFESTCTCGQKLLPSPMDGVRSLQGVGSSASTSFAANESVGVTSRVCHTPTQSDWSLSELSSGLIMCEHNVTRLRNKVRRKHLQKVAPSRRPNASALLPLEPTASLSDVCAPNNDCHEGSKAECNSDDQDDSFNQLYSDACESAAVDAGGVGGGGGINNRGGEKLGCCPSEDLCHHCRRLRQATTYNSISLLSSGFRRDRAQLNRAAPKPASFRAPIRPRSRPRAPAKAASTGGESSSDDVENAPNETSSLFIPCNGDQDFTRNKPTLQSQRRTKSGQGPSAASVVGYKKSASNCCKTVRKSFSERGRSAGAVFALPPTTPTGSQSGFSTDSGFPVLPPTSVNATTAVGIAVRQHRAPQSSQSQQRCNACGFKLTVANTFQCRCGKTLCGKHRNAESHCCSYDYKGEGRKILQKENPKVMSLKLPKS